MAPISDTKIACFFYWMAKAEKRLIIVIGSEKTILPLMKYFSKLNTVELVLWVITTDGNTSVIRALKAVWPDIIIQRCLAHIQRQGLSWLRRYPKLEAAKELRKIFLAVAKIESYCQRDKFLNTFMNWEKRYGQSVKLLPSSHKVFGDLQRARSLLLNAWPDMFHYLNDSKIASTTNRIEGYFSTIKGRYKQHHGLSKENRPKYLFWYIYLKNNTQFTNTLPT